MPVASAMRTMRWKLAMTAAASTSACVAERAAQRAARSGQRQIVVAHDRLRERDQRPGVGHAAPLGGFAVGHRGEVDPPVSGLAARPEQHGVRRRSVEALVERGDASGEQLDLRTVERAPGVRLRVSQLRGRDVVGGGEIAHLSHGVGHE